MDQGRGGGKGRSVSAAGELKRMVSQLAKENYTRVMFRSLQEREEGAGASWLSGLRERAFERFEQQGFPTIEQEEWKYTNIASLAKTRFELATHASTPGMDAKRLEPFIYRESRESRLVFVNGIFYPSLSSLGALDSGILALDLTVALQDEKYATFIREQLERDATSEENSLASLNTAMLAGGAFILVPQGRQVDAPIHLLFISDPRADAPPAFFPRVFVLAERGSSATVIESYVSAQDGLYWTNVVTEVWLEEDARLVHYKVQNESADAFHVATTKAVLGRSSSYNATTVTLGAQISRHDIRVSLEQEGAECRVDGLYIVGAGQHADTHSLIDHLQPNCTSRQLYKGILDGKSRAVFNGKVFVHEGARGTDAQQTNRNLLLSKEARVDTKPQLEIFNDDVKCAHGATVGQLEEEELFYLTSRGLHPELAQNLLTYGFAEEVIEKIKIDSIKAQLDETILARLHTRLEA
ncbi:MAG TPA: Fe-S cluster assembly protein SufD [Pyrinomonadaceae bacterium]